MERKATHRMSTLLISVRNVKVFQRKAAKVAVKREKPRNRTPD